MYGKIHRADLSATDPLTGQAQITEIDVDDSWVRENTRQLLLTADKLSVLANGSDAATISVQLATMPLVSSGLAENVAETVTVQFMIDGRAQKLQLDDKGFGQFKITASAAGRFLIRDISVNGATLEITAA